MYIFQFIYHFIIGLTFVIATIQISKPPIFFITYNFLCPNFLITQDFIFLNLVLKFIFNIFNQYSFYLQVIMIQAHQFNFEIFPKVFRFPILYFYYLTFSMYYILLNLIFSII